MYLYNCLINLINNPSKNRTTILINKLPKVHVVSLCKILIVSLCKIHIYLIFNYNFLDYTDV